MTEPTMEEYVNKTQGDYYSGITKINGKAAYELKGKFLDDLQNNDFSGTNGEDAVEHIENFLKIVDPLGFPSESYERLRLDVFPISLTGDASEWLMNEPQISMTTLGDLMELFFGKYYPPSRTGKIVGTKAKWDSTNAVFEKWLASKFTNHMMMDPFTKNALWDYWKKGDDQEVLTDEAFSDLEETYDDGEQEIAKIFRIETNLFDFETPLCKAFIEFNYFSKLILICLLVISPDSRRMTNLKMNGWTNGTKGYHGFPRNHGLKMKFPLMISIIFANLSISRMEKPKGPLVVQTARDFVMGENYQGWFELVT
ncbi:hypothetical protein Tco_0953480 [Tanacetum coccineum]|uniref:Retrotransposon gag domain-containing protein n=1 Tax=Tanacetum coccineum TaxID=301880 RepID=A0ABQ5E008_9ASTR